MSRGLTALLFALFAATGFSALTLQVVWQRVISMHAGVDLFSFTTIVAAFLAGIGIGTLVGGTLADRLGPRRSLLAYAAANAGIGLFAWFSIWLLYDVYASVVPSLGGTFPSFLFNFLLLIVPTGLMGISLPVVARGLVDRIETAAAQVGRLYAVNTIGAGVGAAVSGWLLVGNLGFVATVRLAGTVNLLASVAVFALWRTASRAQAADPGAETVATQLHTPERPAVRVWPWYVVYGLTGAVALGFELVFFRVVDALMRSNSYTFGHVLMLYLVLFGTGTAIASKFVWRARRPDRWFLGLQFGVGLGALTGVLALVEGPGLLGVQSWFSSQFAIDGYNVGGYRWWPLGELARMTFVHALGPLMIMGLPVLLMGAAFPFVQALVAGRMDSLGRRTGFLLFANVLGNVVGTLIVGFFLIDRLGTSGTMRLLAGLLLIPGLAAAALAGNRARRLGLGAASAGVMAVALLAFPSNVELWSFLHSGDGRNFRLVENRNCVTAMREQAGEDMLYVNGASQNAFPYDDFHVLIGLVPALMHPDPNRALAAGLGIGGTPYGMSLDPRVDDVDVIELCSGEIDLLRGLAAQGSRENQRLFSDPRIDLHTGDGRKYLLGNDRPNDVITVDAIRQQSAYSGNLYSVEFYELLKARLAPGGLMSQWLPSSRTINSATEVFRYAVSFRVESYNGSVFFVASQEPIVFDRPAILQRVDQLIADARQRFALPEGQLEAFRNFFATIEPVTLQKDGPAAPVREDQLNRDLFPRDEYFLNNPPIVDARPRPSKEP